jgi:hypothetical protein
MSDRLSNILRNGSKYNIQTHRNNRGVHVRSETNYESSDLCLISDDEIKQFGLERMADSIYHFYEVFRKEQDDISYKVFEAKNRGSRVSTEDKWFFDVKTPRNIDFYAQIKLEHGDIIKRPQKGTAAARRAYTNPYNDFPMAVPRALTGQTLHRNITVYIDVKQGVFEDGRLIKMYDDALTSISEVGRFRQYLEQRMGLR